MGSSPEQPGDMYAITVRPAECVTVPKEQWREYEVEAERLQVQLHRAWADQEATSPLPPSSPSPDEAVG
jgi:hypothetical protein